jgi:hypothetical protein
MRPADQEASPFYCEFPLTPARTPHPAITADLNYDSKIPFLFAFFTFRPHQEAIQSHQYFSENHIFV